MQSGGASTKAFVLLLVAVLVLGAGTGGAFAAGMALGKSQGEKEARSALSSPTALGSGGAGQQAQGQLSQEQLQQLRQQFQGQSGQGDQPRPTGVGGLTGTVEKVEGDTVTVNTAQGLLQATVAADTAIQVLAEGTLQDLTVGLRVTVAGQRGEDGTVAARSILVGDDGAAFFGGGFFGSQRQSGQGSP